jgi:predicted aspartyl protease
MWDTGATISVIRPEVASGLHLEQVSDIVLSTPSGTMYCRQYYVDILLPNNIKIDRVLVAEASPEFCDAVIGMDIIRRGDVIINNHDDRTVFSYRIPSTGTISFDF